MTENPIHLDDIETSVDAQKTMAKVIRLVAADALRNIPKSDLHALRLAIGLKSDEALEEWCAKKSGDLNYINYLKLELNDIMKYMKQSKWQSRAVFFI